MYRTPYFDNKFKLFLIYHIFSFIVDAFMLSLVALKIRAIYLAIYLKPYTIAFTCLLSMYYMHHFVNCIYRLPKLFQRNTWGKFTSCCHRLQHTLILLIILMPFYLLKALKLLYYVAGCSHSKCFMINNKDNIIGPRELHRLSAGTFERVIHIFILPAFIVLESIFLGQYASDKSLSKIQESN